VETVNLSLRLEELWLTFQAWLFSNDALNHPSGEAAEPQPNSEPFEVAVWAAGLSHRDWLRLAARRG